MTHSKIKKHSIGKTLFLIFLMLQITACNNGGTVETATDDTFIESVDNSPEGSETTGLTDVSLSWAAPSEREDSKPLSLSEIAGYKIYYGTSTKAYSDHIIIDHGSTDSYTFNNLTAGAYYFAITTFDTAGRESQHSTEIIKEVQANIDILVLDDNY
jgi:hypothetical protein